MTLRDLFGLPIGVGFLGDVLFTGGDIAVSLLLFLMETGEVWYTPLAVTASTIAPEVSFLDQQLLMHLTVFAAAFYVANIVRRQYNRYTNDDD